ncbi:hypothetical protein BJ508DRAFT_323414 [Ascobolus immersus RN42]|uniref:Uncharacterized protein n=1 Tax=Ascobolus immersus RN42 TaxID=1160509 RepID=A0A3N4IIF6_ASCIM|nr:hypothetical protein BJ508DRAFT_323414 [Ascobolus immersus RN42]
MAPKLVETPPQHTSSHRRITSLKNSTISWFKNSNRPFTSGGDRERSTATFETAQNNALSDLPEIAAQRTPEPTPVPAPAPQHVHACSFDASMARNLTSSDGSFNGYAQPSNAFEEIAIEEHRQAFKKKRVYSQNDLLHDVPETPVTGEFPCAGPSGSERPKRRSTKFKMALSLLRRRSNSNMRKGQEDQPEESPREPPQCVVESRPGSTSPLHRNGPPPSRSSRGSVRLQKLHKQPSILTPRRRATVDVASVVAEEGPEDVLEMRQDPNHWESERIRAISSHSSLPLTPVASRADDDVRSSVGNEDLLAAAAEQYTILQPRPSSARRHLKQRTSVWSSREDTSSRQGNYLTIEEADRHKMGSRDRTGSRASSRTSFAGIQNSNSSELESRVRELEMQVASLQIFISNHVQGQRLKTPTNSISRPSRFAARRRFSSPSLKVATTEPAEQQTPSERSPIKARFQLPPVAAPLRAQEDINSSTSKTRTEALITDPGLDESFTTLMPNNRLNETQYTGLITMLQREQSARRRLESQVTKMHEQMAMLLERTMYSGDHPSTYSVNDMHDHRKTSTGVPTPELTPPRPRLPSDAFDGISLRGPHRESGEVAIATGEDDDNNIFGIRFGQEDLPIEPNSTSTSIGHKTVTPIEPANPVAALATIEASPLPASPALSLSRLTKIH